jgi:hypothetical protein
MTATLTDAIEAAKQREQIARWDAGEARLVAELPMRPPPIELSADIRSSLDAFSKWAESKSARRLPAKPATVASFLLEQAVRGVPAQSILDQLDAIERSHDRHSLSNPVRTAVVREVLGTIIKVDPPRSWPATDKVAFARLPADIRQAIASRERDRDRALRNAQHKIAAERRLMNGAVTKPVQSTNEGIEANGYPQA